MSKAFTKLAQILPELGSSMKAARTALNKGTGAIVTMTKELGQTITKSLKNNIDTLSQQLDNVSESTDFLKSVNGGESLEAIAENAVALRKTSGIGDKADAVLEIVTDVASSRLLKEGVENTTEVLEKTLKAVGKVDEKLAKNVETLGKLADNITNVGDDVSDLVTNTKEAIGEVSEYASDGFRAAVEKLDELTDVDALKKFAKGGEFYKQSLENIAGNAGVITKQMASAGNATKAGKAMGASSGMISQLRSVIWSGVKKGKAWIKNSKYVIGIGAAIAIYHWAKQRKKPVVKVYEDLIDEMDKEDAESSNDPIKQIETFVKEYKWLLVACCFLCIFMICSLGAIMMLSKGKGQNNGYY